MNRGHKWLFPALSAGAVILAVGLCWPQSHGQTQSQPPQKKGVDQQKQEATEEYTEEEYDAYQKATQEPDLVKRQAALIAFMEKYPKSKLQEHIVYAYQTLMFEYSKNGDYAKLEPAAEQWLKYKPNDLQTIAFVADAALKLGHDKKFIEYGEKVFAQKPDPRLAFALYQAYQKTGDEDRKIDMIMKLLEYPEYNDNVVLRMELVQKYAAEKGQLPKAAQYAELALKSLAIAKKPEGTTEGDWNKYTSSVERNCYHLIGMNYYERKKYPEAIQALQKALGAELYDAGYYYIGMCQWEQQNVDDAILSFAITDLLKGEFQAKAKKNCEDLYKGQHNGNLTGIERIYKRAQAVLDSRKMAVKKLGF
jgi:tetratricopeptide (TPR) repeat protein